MDAMRAGEFVPPPDESYDPEADMRAHQNSLKRPAVETESYLDKEQLQELRRVQRERVEVRFIKALFLLSSGIDSKFDSQVGKMKLLGMDVKTNMGVRMDGSLLDG
jgi:hypothetical protein